MPSPKKSFSKELRRSLLVEAQSESFFRFFLPRPRPEFSSSLRKKLLLSGFSRSPRAFSSSRFSKKIFSGYSRVFSGILATTLLFFWGVPLFFASPIRATEGTRISDFQGSVRLLRDGGEETVVTNDIFLNAGTTLETKDNSFAEVRFFEDSILRLDSNTRIKIELLAPHYARSDLGHIQVSLESGRAWVRSFSAETDFSEFSLRIEGAAILSKNGAAIEAMTSSFESSFLVHDRSARLFSGGTEYFLPAGQSWISLQSGSKIASFSESDEWAEQNLRADRVIVQALLQEKMAAQKESFLKTLTEFFGPPTETEEVFFDLVSQSFDEKDISENFERFSVRIHDDFSKNPEATLAFLAAAEKNFAGVLPDSPLFVLKTKMEILSDKIGNVPDAVAAESKKTTRLWEARDLATLGKADLAAEIVSETVSEEVFNENPSPSVLEEKTEQIAAISEIPETNADEEKIIAELPHLALRGLNKPKSDPIQSAQEIVRRVKIYESEAGQENTLRAHLNEVSDLATLSEIRRRVPENLVSTVNERIFVILDLERKKTKSNPVL